MGCRLRARSVLQCHGVWVLRRGPLTGPVQDARQLQEDTGKLSLELVSRQFRRQTFGTVGCRLRARSVLQCHGVWALRRGPLTGPVQDARQLQEDTGKLAGGRAKGRAKSKFPSVPWCFGGPAEESFDRTCAGRTQAARRHGQS